MVVFRKILVPTGGSTVANSALLAARTIARTSGAEVVLVQVLPADVERGSQLTQQARRDLERIEEEAAARDLSVRSLVRYGDPAEQILQAAHEEDVDLIAMASYGLAGIDRMLVGSVSEQVVARSVVPVLLNRHDARPMRHLQRILVPTDGSPGAALSLSAALPLSRASGASLLLVRVTKHVRDSAYHVAESGELGEDLQVGHQYEEANRLRAEDETRHIVTELTAKGYAAGAMALSGDPARGIVETASEYKADLIVMSTHALMGVARAVLGSVADEVVRTADCPVLLVHWRDWLGRVEQQPSVTTAHQ